MNEHDRLMRADSSATGQGIIRHPCVRFLAGCAILIVSTGGIVGCGGAEVAEYQEYVPVEKIDSVEDNVRSPREGSPDIATTSADPLPENDDQQVNASETADTATEVAAAEAPTTGDPASATQEPEASANAQANQRLTAKGGNPARTTVPAPALPSTTSDQSAPTGESQLARSREPVASPNAQPVERNGSNPAASIPEDSTATGTSTGSREVKLLVKDRQFKTEGPEGALRISYDDFDLLKVLNMDPVTADAPELLPSWLRELDGKRVRLRGFMYPPFEETGLRGFVLARDNQICCFGRNPKVYDLVEVTMRKGETTNYIQNRPFDVVGIFRIEPSVLDGELFGLYQIDDAIVID